MKPYILVQPNQPWEAPWVLREYDTVEEAKEEAWKMAQRRKPEDPTRYKVNGFTY
jgi:hypothetical protein